MYTYTHGDDVVASRLNYALQKIVANLSLSHHPHMQNHHSNAPPLITTLTSHYFILHLSSPFQLESRVEHHMIQPNQPLTPHPLNNEKKRMETGTNGETPATSELDLSIILQGIL